MVSSAVLLRIGSLDSKVGSACYLLHDGFLLRLFFEPEDGGGMFLPERRLILDELHGVISYNIQLFVFLSAYINYSSIFNRVTGRLIVVCVFFRYYTLIY
jgi:hypothetical protein